MKFPRHARFLVNQLDITPFASVFFLLVIFMMLASLVYTPGVRIQLPPADGLAGTDKPTVAVAMDAGGSLFFKSQRIDPKELKSRLAEAAANSPGPLTLVVKADKAVTQEKLESLLALARGAGIQEALLARLPRVGESPSQPAPKP